MSATENFVASVAPANIPPQPAEVPPSAPLPSEVETPPIPVEMPADSPVEPMILQRAPPGISGLALTSPLPQTRAKTKGVADLVFLVDVSGSMATCIDALRGNIEAFIDSLRRGDANNAAPVRDWRAKVVGY